MISYFYGKLRSGVGITTVSAWVTRVATAVLQILSVRAAILLIGTNQYSVVAIIMGLQAWFLLLDFGGSFSFLNYASEKQAIGKRAEDCLACGLLWSIASVLLGVLLLNVVATPVANWLFQNGSTAAGAKDAQTALRLGGTLLILFANTQIVSRLWLAEGRGYLANILPVSGALATFLIFRLASFYGKPEFDVTSVTLIFCLPNAVIQLACLTWVAWKRRVSPGSCDKTFFRVFSLRSGQAFIFSLQAACTLQIDYIILSQLANPSEIVIYSIFSRVFVLLSFVYTSVLTSLWPVVSHNIVHGKVPELKQIMRNLFIAGTAFVLVASAGILVFQEPIILLMTHGQATFTPPFLVLLMGLNQVAVLWVSILSQIMQVAGRLKIMINAAFFQLVISVCLQYSLTTRYGIVGIVSGVLLSYMIGGFIPLVFFVRQYLSKLEKEGPAMVAPAH